MLVSKFKMETNNFAVSAAPTLIHFALRATMSRCALFQLFWSLPKVSPVWMETHPHFHAQKAPSGPQKAPPHTHVYPAQCTSLMLNLDKLLASRVAQRPSNPKKARKHAPAFSKAGCFRYGPHLFDSRQRSRDGLPRNSWQISLYISSLQPSDAQCPCAPGYKSPTEDRRWDCVKQTYPICRDGAVRNQEGQCLSKDEWIGYCSEKVL